MGRIFRRVTVQGSKNFPIQLRALFDTGSDNNYIVPNFFKEGSVEDLGIIEYGENELTTLSDGSPIECRRIKLKSIEIEGKIILNPEFRLLDMPGCEILIGAKTMQKLKMVLNPSIHELSFNQS